MMGGGRGLTDRRRSQWRGRVRQAGGDWRTRTRAGGRGAESYWLWRRSREGGGLGCRWPGGPGESQGRGVSRGPVASSGPRAFFCPACSGPSRPPSLCSPRPVTALTLVPAAAPPAGMR